MVVAALEYRLETAFAFRFGTVEPVRLARMPVAAPGAASKPGAQQRRQERASLFSSRLPGCELQSYLRQWALLESSPLIESVIDIEPVIWMSMILQSSAELQRKSHDMGTGS